MAAAIELSWSVFDVPSTINGHDVLCVHVVPNFGGAHTQIGDTCACGPELEWLPKACLVTHRVFRHLRVVKP